MPKKPTNNPIMITITPNPEMGAWDLAVHIGNFQSQTEAEEVSHKIAEMLREVVGATMHRAQ